MRSSLSTTAGCLAATTGPDNSIFVTSTLSALGGLGAD